MTVTNRGKLIIADPKGHSAGISKSSGISNGGTYKSLSSSSLWSGESTDASLPPRHDFGMGFGSCSICGAPRCLNRGCSVTRKIVCAECWPAYIKSRSFIEPLPDGSDFYKYNPRGELLSLKPDISQNIVEKTGFKVMPSVGSWLMPLPLKLRTDLPPEPPAATLLQPAQIADEAHKDVSSFISLQSDTDDEETCKANRTKTIVDVDAGLLTSPETLQKMTEDPPHTPKKANKITVSFCPGTLGITFTEDTITATSEGGQAQEKGVEVGWRIKQVNGRKCRYFGDPQLAEVVNGKYPFTITFEKPKEKVFVPLKQDDLPTIQEDEDPYSPTTIKQSSSCVVTPKVAPVEDSISESSASGQKEQISTVVPGRLTDKLLMEHEAILQAQERDAAAVLAQMDQQAMKLSENAAQLSATKQGLQPLGALGDLDQQLNQIKVAGESPALARSQVQSSLRAAEEATKATATTIAENDAVITDLEALLLKQENEALAALAAVEEKAKVAASRIEKLEVHRNRSTSTQGAQSLEDVVDEQQARTEVLEAAQDKAKLQEEIVGLQQKLQTVVEGKKTVSTALMAMEEREKAARARIQALESTIAAKEDDLTKNMTIANEMIRHLKRQQEEKDAEFERFKISMEEAEEHEASASIHGCVSNSWIGASFCASGEMPTTSRNSGVADWLKNFFR